jgi:hypothetical protein
MAHHMGHMEFFLCDTSTVSGSTVTQECFSRTPLMRDPTDTAISPPDTRSQYAGRYYLDPRCAKSTTDAWYTTPLNTSSLYTSAAAINDFDSKHTMRMRCVSLGMLAFESLLFS